MTIASATSKISYSGSGSTGPYSIPFKFIKDADIVATHVSTAGIETTLTLTTHYSLTGAGDSSGGALTLVTALATGEKLVISRAPAIVQETKYPENADFPSSAHEDALDLLTMFCQSLQEQIDRAVLVPISSSADPADLLDELTADVVSAAASAATATTQAGLATTAQGLAEDARDAAVAAVGAVKVSADDTTAGYLDGKLALASGSGLVLAVTSPAGDEVLTIGVDFAEVQAYDANTMKSDMVTARTRAHSFTPVAVTASAGGALAIDCDLHEECTITLAETTTTVGQASNQADGKYVVLVITGTTGKALAWNTNWDKDGADCTIAAPANGVVDMHCFRSNGSVMKHIGSKLAV